MSRIFHKMFIVIMLMKSHFHPVFCNEFHYIQTFSNDPYDSNVSFCEKQLRNKFISYLLSACQLKINQILVKQSS